MFRTVIIFFLLVLNLKSQISFPITTGSLVFHRYSAWENWDGKLFLYEFSTKNLTELSKQWTEIEHTCNAHFSPDGTKIVFMAVPKNKRSSNSWNIYLYDFTNPEVVINLTPNSVLDQDPKFFKDGINICYKSDGDLRILNTQTLTSKKVTNDGWSVEESMPYPTTDGKKIIYSSGEGDDTHIYSVNIDGSDKKVIENTNGVHSYYPMVKDDSTYIFTRGFSASNNADELYLADYNGTSYSLGFNSETADDSDSFPVDSQYVFFSSNRLGTKGGWDLFLGNSKTGSSWTLSIFGVNSNLHELGVCYSPFSVVTSIEQSKIKKPDIILDQNYPNPFNSSSRVNFYIPQSGNVKIDIINSVGELVKGYEFGYLSSGEHTFILESSFLTSGIYYYQFHINNTTITKKCVIVK